MRIDLRGEPLVTLARALVKLDGVRVTGGSEGMSGGRCYIVSCLGFKMVLSSTIDDGDEVARALVSREPQPPLAVLSELGSVIDQLMSPPVAPGARKRSGPTIEGRDGVDPDDDTAASSRSSASALRSTALRPGKPLARRTALKRKTPLARSPSNKF